MIRPFSRLVHSARSYVHIVRFYDCFHKVRKFSSSLQQAGCTIFRTAPEPGYHDGTKFMGIQYTRDRAWDGTGSIWRLQEELDDSDDLGEPGYLGDSDDLDDSDGWNDSDGLGYLDEPS